MKKRYSKYINLIFFVLDIMVIGIIAFLQNDAEYTNPYFLGYSMLFWLISSLFTSFYEVYRYTSFFRVGGLLVKQLSVFTLGYFSYFTIFREGVVVNNQAKYIITVVICASLVKIIGIYLLKKYRTYGKNYRKVIVIGGDTSVKKLIDIFKKDKELGYQFYGFFSDKNKETKGEYLGKVAQSFRYIIKNEIDEIYCSLSEVGEKEIKKITKFANKNNRVLKLVPNANELYNKNITSEFYGDSTLVLKLKKMPFELLENRIVKRIFDILFSFFVCVLILSWLYPILFILIKIESKGPVIFKQKREGLNGGDFICYKFRSMYVNSLADEIHASKNDNRITKIGAFLRKTSLDEFPQFFNVFLGSMSVVGPRPHIEKLAAEYQKDVENYIERHNVKPGITGLAQVSGYRGEIKKKSDIKNRVRLDIFYIENWSLALDLKIVIKTVLNIFKGDEKAY